MLKMKGVCSLGRVVMNTDCSGPISATSDVTHVLRTNWPCTPFLFQKKGHFQFIFLKFSQQV